MQTFELTILGSSSATPTSTRNPTAQLLNIADRFFLIDCGEATQIQLRRFKIRFQRINHIFISHLHGDHFFGLVGLLSSMHLLGRKDPLHVYAPPNLEEIIQVQHKYSGTELKYNVVFHILDCFKNEKIFEDDKLTVETIPLNHRIPCCGFLFREKLLSKNMIKEQIEAFSIPLEKIAAIKSGDDFITEKGLRIKNEELTIDPAPSRSYAYCSDTCYDESIIPYIKGVDLLYHEATFMQDMADRAKDTYHSTTLDAGTIASKAEVKKLIIGHFSARYKELEPLSMETQGIFKNVVLAIEGEKHLI